jgi:hypothetical protein
MMSAFLSRVRILFEKQSKVMDEIRAENIYNSYEYNETYPVLVQ